MPFSAIIGGISAAVGIGNTLFGGGGGGGNLQTETPQTTLKNTKEASTTARPQMQGGIQTAKAVGATSTNLPDQQNDPWENTRTWATNLGADPQAVKQINSENMPF